MYNFYCASGEIFKIHWNKVQFLYKELIDVPMQYQYLHYFIIVQGFKMQDVEICLTAVCLQFDMVAVPQGESQCVFNIVLIITINICAYSARHLLYLLISFA